MEEIITLDQALKLIRKTLEAEKEREVFYDGLLGVCPNLKESIIISSMSREHRKHSEILREIYTRLTGEDLPYISFIPEEYSNMSYEEGLEKGLFQDLEEVTKYRKIMGAMPDGESYTLLMSIMTDMIRNASRYNFLISIQK